MSESTPAAPAPAPTPVEESGRRIRVALLGGELHVGVLLVAVAGMLVLLYYNRSIGCLTKAFYGVRDAVARS